MTTPRGGVLAWYTETTTQPSDGSTKMLGTSREFPRWLGSGETRRSTSPAVAGFGRPLLRPLVGVVHPLSLAVLLLDYVGNDSDAGRGNACWDDEQELVAGQELDFHDLTDRRLEHAKPIGDPVQVVVAMRDPPRRLGDPVVSDRDPVHVRQLLWRRVAIDTEGCPEQRRSKALVDPEVAAALTGRQEGGRLPLRLSVRVVR